MAEGFAELAGEGVRGVNRARILSEIHRQPGSDRTLIADRTGLTAAAVTRIVAELIEADLVESAPALERPGVGRGRRRQGLRVAAGGGWVVGVGLLAYNPALTLMDLSGSVIEERPLRLDRIDDPARALDEVAGQVKRLIVSHDIDRARLLGVLAAVGGFFRPDGEILAHAPYLAWPSFNVRASLERRIGLPVVTENANRALALSECRFGNAVEVSDLILVRAALNIGGAIVANGAILRGADNGAGQFGHFPVPGGTLACSCGRVGCLNTVASGWALLNALGRTDTLARGIRALNSQENALRVLLHEYRAGTVDAADALEDVGRALGANLAGLVQALSPQMILLAGPLGREAPYAQGVRVGLGDAQVEVVGPGADVTSVATAAARLAIAAFLLSPQLDMRRLTDAGGAAGRQPGAREGGLL